MKIYLTLSFWLVSLVFSVFAQNGNFYLSNYQPNDEKIDYRSSAMVQDEFGVIYFTNKTGILEFDGKNWKLIPTSGATYTLAAHKKDLYVGGIFGFGKLSERKGAVRKYLPLVELSNVFSSFITDELAYLCNEEKLVVFSLTTNSIAKTIQLGADDSFTGIHHIGGKVFASTTKNGHLVIDGDKLSSPPFTFPTNQIVLILRLNHRQ